jgi:hypothetical protein
LKGFFFPPRERVYAIAGDSRNGTGVDRQSCEPCPGLAVRRKPVIFSVDREAVVEYGVVVVVSDRLLSVRNDLSETRSVWMSISPDHPVRGNILISGSSE